MSGPSSSSFLNRTGGQVAGITLANASNPINWGKLGKTLIGGGITMSFAGVFGVLSGLTQIVIQPLGAAQSSLSAIIGSLSAGVGTMLWTAKGSTATALGQLGVLAWPVGIAIVVASLYLAARGAQAIGLGGSV